MTHSSHPLRVMYFGTYRAEYARNMIQIEGLRRAGVSVIECHQPLWTGIEDRVQAASGGWLRPTFCWRVVRTYTALLRKYVSLAKRGFDILVVGYPGQFDVFLARLIAWLWRKPLAWDVLNSLYLISLERGLDQRSPSTIRLIRFAEKLACRLPDLLVLDTPQFVAWFQETHGIDPQRFRIVQIGADEREFHPLPQAHSDDRFFRVIYYGTYIPNHGVNTIIETARILNSEPGYQLVMVGRGPEKAQAEALVQRYRLTNVQFIDWLDHDALVREISQADVVLGVFGATRQMQLTNNNKIYEGFALQRPVISARSPALPPILKDGEHLLLCPPADPQALAQAIRRLKSDPQLRERLAHNGNQVFHEQFTVTQIGQRFAGHLRALASARSRR